MKKNDIPIIAKYCLDSILDLPGSILYSSHETLKLGAVYLIGFNPGGAGGLAVEKSIESMLTNTVNSYIDEEWGNLNNSWSSGEAPLQKKVQWLLKSIGLEPRNVCASNLIFFQSRAAVDIDYALASRCWPVHEAILSIVNPKLIIAFGNSAVSPYGYLHSLFGGQEEFASAGHGNWCLKGFHCQINMRNVYVAGLPHLSRYSPKGNKQVVEWLSKHI